MSICLISIISTLISVSLLITSSIAYFQSKTTEDNQIQVTCEICSCKIAGEAYCNGHWDCYSYELDYCLTINDTKYQGFYNIEWSRKCPDPFAVPCFYDQRQIPPNIVFDKYEANPTFLILSDISLIIPIICLFILLYRNKQEVKDFLSKFVILTSCTFAYLCEKIKDRKEYIEL